MATRAPSDDDGNEQSLIEAARGGDARAFEQLLGRHEARVFRVLRLLGVSATDREDVAQIVFLRIFRGLDGFKSGRPFASWVYKIAANAALDWRGQSDRQRREEAPWDEALEEAPLSPSAGRIDLARRLEAALDTLSERERAVFVLVEMEGLERSEAGRALGISGITIRRHLGLAKERLREALSKKKIIGALNISRPGAVFTGREGTPMERRDNDMLEEALAAWRATSEDEALSGTARAALFDSVRASGGADQAPFLSGLTRAWRWAFLGSVPVVALAAVLMVAGDRHPAAGGARLSATKVDGQVVFTLANGPTEHLVYRSTDPQSLDHVAAVRMARNRYSENATGGPTLVFYRID